MQEKHKLVVRAVCVWPHRQKNFRRRRVLQPQLNVFGHVLSFFIACFGVISLVSIVLGLQHESLAKNSFEAMSVEPSIAHSTNNKNTRPNITTDKQISDILSQGYIGTYGAPPALPLIRIQEQRSLRPLDVQRNKPTRSSEPNSHESTLPLARADWENLAHTYATHVLLTSVTFPQSQKKPQLQHNRTQPSKTKHTQNNIQNKAAVTSKKWQSKKIAESYKTLHIDAGKAATFWVDFQNTGTETWRSTGKHFIALNVTNPAGRESFFHHMFWPKSFRPAIMKDNEVPPGKTTRIFFALQAPDAGGTFEESFALVAENLLWIPGGEVTLKIKVNDPPPLYSAKKVSQSFDTMNITPGQAFTFWVEFKNTGRSPWYNDGENFIALNVADPSGRTSPFQHESWKEFPYRPTRLDQKKVTPGEIGRFTSALKAPETQGNYVENFHIVSENLTWISGGHVRLPVIVKQKPGNTKKAANEPNIRIGLYEPQNSVQMKSFYGTLTLQRTNGEILETFSEDTIVVLNYQNAVYTASIADRSYSDPQPFRVTSEAKKGVIEIVNYENRPPWNAALNDNTFRGALELVVNNKTQTLWVVNELPLESYLYGIAEAGNENDVDYLKALMTAARTYALYHYQNPTKYAGAPFLLTATAADQLYRGFGFESRASNIAKAAKETSGRVVTYQGEVVVTPYFSQSDGRTRAWEEVWAGGPKPWLVSVPDPCCTEKELLGHGIGMSAAGARHFANEGKSWDWILTYYYTGVALQE